MSDTATICRLAHAHGVAVPVDEAHGSYLRFHSELPQSTVSLRADIIVQSTHKTQGSLYNQQCCTAMIKILLIEYV
jgi:arginine/lysine/ornithine decarboxylase